VSQSKIESDEIGARITSAIERAALIGADAKSFDDFGLAARFHRKHSGTVLHVTAMKESGWFIWDGKRFKSDDTDRIKLLSKKLIRELHLEEVADDRREKFLAWCSKQNTAETVRMLLGLVAPMVAVTPDQLDGNPSVLNVHNGTIDLRTGQLRKHDPGDQITKLANVVFEPSARSELWDRYIDRCTGGDKGLAKYIQRALGYSLLGKVREKHFWYVWGGKHTGKSVLMRTIGSLLGDYHMSADFSTWLEQNRKGGNRGDIVRLMGARWVTSIEPPENPSFDVGLIKQITGGDPLTHSDKYIKHVCFTAQFKLWLVANVASAIPAHDEASWDRLIVVPLDNFVPKNEQDPELDQKLQADSSAILNWMLEGLREYLENGLGSCGAVDRASAKYRAETDTVSRWASERLDFSVRHSFMSSAQLRESYADWSASEGVPGELGKKALAQLMKAHGCEQGSNGSARGYRGVSFARD
jgi:putative DNA primase/helicase